MLFYYLLKICDTKILIFLVFKALIMMEFAVALFYIDKCQINHVAVKSESRKFKG